MWLIILQENCYIIMFLFCFLAMHHTEVLYAGIRCRKLTQCHHVAFHVCIADHFPAPTNAGRHLGGLVSLLEVLSKTPCCSALRRTRKQSCCFVRNLQLLMLALIHCHLRGVCVCVCEDEGGTFIRWKSQTGRTGLIVLRGINTLETLPSGFPQ